MENPKTHFKLSRVIFVWAVSMCMATESRHFRQPKEHDLAVFDKIYYDESECVKDSDCEVDGEFKLDPDYDKLSSKYLIESYQRKICGLLEPRSVGIEKVNIAEHYKYTRAMQCLSEKTCSFKRASYISMEHMVFCNTELEGKVMDARFRISASSNELKSYNYLESNPICDNIEFGDSCGEDKVCVLA